MLELKGELHKTHQGLKISGKCGKKRREVLVVSQVSAAIVACESHPAHVIPPCASLVCGPAPRQPPTVSMADNTSAPDCWEAAADDSISTLPTSLSTLNVNAPVFIPNVNAPEFVPSFMKEEAGQTQPAAPGEPEAGAGREGGRVWVCQGK